MLLVLLTLAQYDPTLVFSTVETEHFRVHFHQGYYDYALDTARVAEASLKEVQGLLGHTMPDKIELVLSDDTDDANGSATVVPYPLIRAYVTAPDDLSFLAEHNYWNYELIGHEVTHVVHLDTVHNVSKLINIIFGRTWMPNQLQSRWFIEGLAVEVESKISVGGRARARMVDMVLRAEHIENIPIRLDQALSGPYRWPQGNTWYLHGGRFLSFLAERYGHDKLRAISNRYGGTLIPYAMNRAFKAELGRDYDEVWADFRAALNKHYAAQLAPVQADGLVLGRQLTTSGQRIYNPRYGLDGRIYYFAEGYSLIPQLRTVDGGEVTKIKVQGQMSRPDARGRMLMSQQDIVRNFYPFHDLYIYDDGFTRLTEGLRARDPDLSQGYVYFIQSKGVSQQLVRAPLIGSALGRIEPLWDPGTPFQMYTPRVSPNGRFIALSVFHPPGQRDIAIFDLATRQVRWATHDTSLDGGPTWSPDGTLYFHSARTDIFNIYKMGTGTTFVSEFETAKRESSVSQDRTPKVVPVPTFQVTNVMTGAFSPDVSPDGKRMVYLGYSSNGFDVWELELEKGLNKRAREEEREDPMGVEPGSLPVMAEMPRLRPTPYSPWPALLPRQWLPTWSNDALGTVVGVAVAGQDPLGRHRWGAQVGYGVASHDVNYSFAYQNRQLYPLLSVSTARAIQGAPSAARINGLNVFTPERAHNVGLDVVVPYQRQTWSLSFAFSYNFEHRQRLISYELAPDQLAPSFPPTGKFADLGVSFAFSRTRRTVGAISPEYGQRFNLSTLMRDTWLGSDYRQASLQFSAQHYQLMPWLLHHVLTLRIAAGGAYNELATRPLFAFGGLPLRDPIRDILFGGSTGEGGVRGFSPGAFTGNFFYNTTLEYRAPIWRIERGFSTLPLYLRTLAGAAFVDAGYGGLALRETFSSIGVGAGAELRLDFDYGFYYGAMIRLGYARGLTLGGIHNFFLSLSNGF